MKNTIKMSLVAALAVAGLSQTASAGSLEDAIKGVSISGKMEVEYDYNETKNSADVSATDDGKDIDRQWDLDWDVTAKIPVNDMVTAVFGMEGDTEDDTNEKPGGTGGAISTGSNGGSHKESTVNVTKLYFQYANGPVTAMVGKQGVGAPWMDDERGNGVKALYNAGPVTLAAAHFSNVNANANGTTTIGNTDLSAVAAIGSVGPVNAQIWYAQLSGIAAVTTSNQLSADALAIKADAQFDIVNVAASYATADYDLDTPTAGVYNQNNDDAELLKVVASVDAGVATVYAGYGATDSKQGGVGVDLTRDSDASVNFASETLAIDDLDNADAYLVGVTVPMGAWKFDVSYLTGDYSDYIGATPDKDTATAYACDFEETLVQVDYKMSKNFNIGAHWSDSEIEAQTNATTKDKTEETNVSVSLEYKF